MKIIKPRLHGVLDYVTVIFLFLSPWLFSIEGNARIMTWGLAALQLLLSVFTDYPLGLSRQIGFLIHGFIEFTVSFALAIAAIYFRYTGSAHAMFFYCCMAAVYFVVFLLTNFNTESKA